MIDVAALLAPVREDAPAGDDLTYDPERQQIELAFESAVSADSAESDDVDWRGIVQLIVAQSGRTKDVFLAVALARAGARLGDVATVEAGVRFLAGLFEDYWETVHPQLEELGFQGRKGPCEALARYGDFLRPLRRTILLSHPRLGSYHGEDFERFATGGANEDGYGMFRAALNDVGAEGLREVLDRIDAIRDAIRRVDGALTGHADGDTGTNFADTYAAIEAIRGGVAAFAGDADAPEAISADGGGEQGSVVGGSGSGGAGAGGPGFSAARIDGREDVIRAIDAIIDYYARREPGSPLPVLLKRARDWVNADFLSLIRDIAPNGVEEVSRVLMATPRDEPY